MVGSRGGMLLVLLRVLELGIQIGINAERLHALIILDFGGSLPLLL